MQAHYLRRGVPPDLISKTLAGPLPVRFLTRLARAAFAKFVAASSVVIPSRCAMRSTNSSSFLVSAAACGAFSVTQKYRLMYAKVASVGLHSRRYLAQDQDVLAREQGRE